MFIIYSQGATGAVVESDEMVEPGCDPERAFRVQADVAIAATPAMGYTRMRPMAYETPGPGEIIQTDDIMRIGT